MTTPPVSPLPQRPERRAYRPPVPPQFLSRPTRFSWQAVAVALFVVDLAIAGWTWLTISGESVGVALLLIPVLMLLTMPLFIHAARVETRWDLGGLLATGLLLRFLAAFYRYHNADDGDVYHYAGVKLAQSFRHLHFGADPGGPVPGTGGMKFIAGITEVIANSNEFAAFLLFSWLGFIGCYLLYRAFCTALPGADHKRYALLIFLWPTLVFWPSSLGKDCWLLFALGIGALGAARIFVRRPAGYTLLAIGMGAGSIVRPHVALIELLAFGFALLIGRQANARPGAITPAAVAKLCGLIVLLVIGALLVNRAADYLNTNDINGVDSALTESVKRTQTGGSAFTAANPKQPIGYTEAAATILFRPFLFEAHGTEQLATAMEGMLLFGLAVCSWKRLTTTRRRLRSEPYVTMAVVYLLIFFFAFGTVSNFGILARERSQGMPFAFVLLSLTPALPALRRTPEVAPRGVSRR